jgi:hypothetical protein
MLELKGKTTHFNRERILRQKKKKPSTPIAKEK